MDEIVAQKRCPRCGEMKTVSEFDRDKSTPTGFDTYCRVCRKKYHVAHREHENERSRKYKAAHGEQVKEYVKEYRATHKGQINKNGRKYYTAHQEQKRKQAKEYRAAHPEYTKKYHAAHREQRNEQSREWHVAHWEQRKEYCTAHKEQRSECIKKWLHNHPGKIAEYHHRWNARRMNAEGNGVTARQWNKLLEEYNYCCAYCNQKVPLAMDHIIPLSKNGRHDIDNVVPACKSCNSSKGDSSLIMFLYRRTL